MLLYLKVCKLKINGNLLMVCYCEKLLLKKKVCFNATLSVLPAKSSQSHPRHIFTSMTIKDSESFVIQTKQVIVCLLKR